MTSATAARKTSRSAPKGRKAPLLDPNGKVSKDLPLEPTVFGAEVKPHLVHEVVRAEAAAERGGTRALKTRGLVAGGRAKPWRQKGTGRARAGTTRAPQWTGGGAAFQPRSSFALKVNRKARRSALSAALSAHAERGTLAVVDGSSFAERPSAKKASEFLDRWAQALPVLVVSTESEETLAKSFRNLRRIAVVEPSELEVGAVVWARALLVTEAALETIRAKVGA